MRRKNLFLIGLFALFSALLMAGCAKKVPPLNFASPMPLVKKAATKDIEAAIIRAGAITNWAIVPAGPGVMTGTLHVRGKHTAIVEIAYDQKEFRITYKDSANLDYGNGKIHRNYNRWVATLEKNIRQELALLNR
ncbi:MAG: hypothetical protein LBP61_03150 [Desulfovibrio sp.]|jgi:uncharacterized lipoprotein YajG|nr:hypothetical protein [Desulfovibrio sp.]